MKQNIQIGILILALLGAGSLFVSCSNSVDSTTGTVTGTWSSLYANVFSDSTTCKDCHRGAGSSSGITNLDFSSSSTSYNQLVNVIVSNPSSPASCNTIRRVDPNQPTKSFLMGLLFSDYNTNNFGGQSGCQPATTHYSVHNVILSSTVKQAIIDWINAGAPQ